MDVPDGECDVSKPKSATPVKIQWNAVRSGAYAVLSGMSPEAAARAQVAVPTDSYWSDVLQDAVLSLLDPLARSYPPTAAEFFERLDRTVASDNAPHPALRDFAALPLSQQIAKLARMAKTRPREPTAFAASTPQTLSRQSPRHPRSLAPGHCG